jgi:hypothetical protein
MLYEKDSPQLVLEACWRHRRQGMAVAGAEELVRAITAPADALEQKVTLLNKARRERQGALDDIIFADKLLDHAITTTHERVSQFDREHLGSGLLGKMFPDGKYGPLVKMKRDKEPDAVDKVAHMLDSLGADHELAALSRPLYEKAQRVRDLITSHADRVRAEKMAEADVELAAADLRRAYEGNYLDARKRFGRELAECLFPHSYHAEAEEQDEPTPQTAN